MRGLQSARSSHFESPRVLCFAQFWSEAVTFFNKYRGLMNVTPEHLMADKAEMAFLADELVRRARC